MNCEVCGNDVSSGYILMGYGFVCSDECSMIAGGKIKAYYDELKAEPLETMPENLETADFERWTLKLALQIIEGMDPKTRERITDTNPFMLQPDTLSLELKEQILAGIPRCYVSEVEARGHDRMFYGGTYCFRQAVPKAVVIEACQTAQILK